MQRKSGLQSGNTNEEESGEKKHGIVDSRNKQHTQEEHASWHANFLDNEVKRAYSKVHSRLESGGMGDINGQTATPCSYIPWEHKRTERQVASSGPKIHKILPG